MRTRRLARRAAVAAFVFGVAFAVGLAAGGGTAAAQTATPPDCSTVGFTQNASGYYEVTNVSQLQCVGNNESGVALDDDYVQTSDIDATETAGWNGLDGFEPISASADGDFTGTFDGNGFHIDALTINRAGEDETGLFAAAGTGAVVTNVTLTGADVTGNYDTGGLVGTNAGEGDLFVGGLIGLSRASVTNATATGDVDGTTYVGGLIGDNRAGVTDSTANGDVTGDGSVGGLIGINSAEVTVSMASGDVTGNGNEVGGLIGDNDAPVSNAKATGNVDGGDYVGGLIGDVRGGPVIDSTANATVTGEDYVGGLIGESAAPVSNARATGPVDGSGNDVGGLIGANYDDVSDAAASADVTGGSRVGGLLGSNVAGTINRSNATGNVTASGQRVGGLVGLNYGFSGTTVRESFATGNVTGDDDTGGLVGQNLDDAIVDSYALGDVDGDDNVGCLVGNHTGSGSTVETSYAACTVTGSTDRGGLIGETNNGASVTNSYWDTDEAGGVGSDGGTGLTTAEMTGVDARSNMTGFDFTNTWYPVQDNYPELSSNTRSSRQPADGGDGSTNESSGAPEITNYDVSADGGEITVSFDSDENLVEITVEITGAETATLDREDFSGDTYSGFNATYDAETDGSYTVELTEARDSSNNDGTEGETFRQSVTVETEDDNGTATPTDNGTVTPTPTDDPDTPTATPTDEPDTPTPTPTAEPETSTPTGPEDTPGFGFVVTVLALLGAALLVHRRRDGAA
ncbi:hypothetical protein BRC75_09155 [Halobacteriales archaeon QH_7_69_31]|nr:MAG: hypothetical protein BRC75_09155 [Halobacteriales archaeon QH_7_69_31]